MVQSNRNIRMSRDEVAHFHKEMERRMRGDFTAAENKRMTARREVYKVIMERNGGRNPLFCE